MGNYLYVQKPVKQSKGIEEESRQGNTIGWKKLNNCYVSPEIYDYLLYKRTPMSNCSLRSGLCTSLTQCPIGFVKLGCVMVSPEVYDFANKNGYL